jgi:hypothetical protein
LPWPFARAIHSHRAIHDQAGDYRHRDDDRFQLADLGRGEAGPAFRDPALLPPMMKTSPMIRLTVLTAAPAYMSLTAVSTGAGAGGGGGPGGWPPGG